MSEIAPWADQERSRNPCQVRPAACPNYNTHEHGISLNAICESMCLSGPVLTVMMAHSRPNTLLVVVVYTVVAFCFLNLMQNAFQTSFIPSFHSDSPPVKTSRLHYLIPTTKIKDPVCAVVASALLNRYSVPTLIGFMGQGEFDAKKAHIAKLRAIARYLNNPEGKEHDDLVMVVDGFDVLAEVPAEEMIERYFDMMAEADRALAHKHGFTVEQAHRRGLRQTLIWGADKGCWPVGSHEPRCWLTPNSTLPRYVFGPRTDSNGRLPYTDPKYLNSGTVMGPLGDLRTLINASLDLITKTWGSFNRSQNSDQRYISGLYARQEYNRILNLTGGEFEVPEGKEVPEPKRGIHDQTEYHVTVDYESWFAMTHCHNEQFVRHLRYNNSDHTAWVTEDIFKERHAFQPFKIQMPASLLHALERLYNMIPDTDPQHPSFHSAKAWVQSLKIGTNVATQNIYALDHATCSKRRFMGRYFKAWYYPYVRPLLRSAALAVQADLPLHPRLIDGRVWKAAQGYPKHLTDEFGGVYTDHEKWPFVPFQKLCARNLTVILGGFKDN